MKIEDIKLLVQKIKDEAIILNLKINVIDKSEFIKRVNVILDTADFILKDKV